MMTRNKAKLEDKLKVQGSQIGAVASIKLSQVDRVLTLTIIPQKNQNLEENKEEKGLDQ